MPRHFRVHELLDAADLAALEAFAREPGRTVDECFEWLQAKGYTMARSSVGTWKADFIARDRFAASNDVAKSLMAAAREGGAVAVSDAANLQVSQMIFEKLLELQQSETVATADLCNLAKAIGNAAKSKNLIEDLKLRAKLAIDEADKVAKGGAGADAVVAKVREILGVAA